MRLQAEAALGLIPTKSACCNQQVVADCCMAEFVLLLMLQLAATNVNHNIRDMHHGSLRQEFCEQQPAMICHLHL